MPTTEKLVIDLPSDIADLVRSRMSSGKYLNESAVIEEALVDTILPPIQAVELDEWIKAEGIRRHNAMRADPSQCMTHEEFWAAVEVDEEHEGKDR